MEYVYFFFGIFRCVLYYFFIIIIRIFFVKNIFNTFIPNKIQNQYYLIPTKILKKINTLFKLNQ